MSIIGSNILAGASGSDVGAYEIEQSLRFDGNAYLSLGTGTTHTTKNYTISFWMKPCEMGTAGTQPNIFRTVGNNNTETNIQNAYNWNATGTNKLGSYWHQTNSGNNYDGGITSAVYRDPSAWYHVVCAIDTTQSTAVDRCKYFVNGVEQVATVGSNPIPQNYSPVFRNFAHRIGEDTNWYLAEYHLTTDGTKAATDFGEYDDNGVWRPIEYTGDYGTFGFYLKFDPDATNGIGHDHSGNGLHWTATGFTTSGTGTDVMSDTPTTNYCTLNPLDFLEVGYKPTLSEGNLKSQNTSARAYGTIAIPSSGKYYYEAKVATVGTSTAAFGVEAAQWGSNGYMYYNGTNTYLSTYTTETLGIAVNVDDGEVTFYKNNTSQGTTSVSNLPGTKPFLNHGGNWHWTINFGQRAFTYTPPTGYVALNTSNLPAPEIKDGSDYFQTVLWTGNATSDRDITVADNSDNAWQPDFVWIKQRSSTEHHQLFDAIRGADARLVSSGTFTEDSSNTERLQAFNSDGFTIGDDTAVNASSATYVAWNWLAGNGTSSNTNGSITSTVSVNATAGFSIVSYTGTTAAATVGHGLGVAPSLVLVKIRSQAGNWQGYHASLGKDYTIKLNTTDAQENIANYWGTGGVTSTVFGVIGGGYGNNVNGATHIAYCFAEVEGYSKFGSYTGNGNADGPFVYCGFKPRWIMIKNTTGNNWAILDTARDTYNGMDERLHPNLNQSTNTGAGVVIDALSNGFKCRNSDDLENESGDTMIFAAFAEHPFGGSGVSPATAR